MWRKLNCDISMQRDFFVLFLHNQACSDGNSSQRALLTFLEEWPTTALDEHQINHTKIRERDLSAALLYDEEY